MSEGPPRISVVVPTFNRLDALRENFSSVRELAGVSEIVVVVDGSTDGTGEWLAGLGDPRVNLIQQARQGSPTARNAGVAAAAGEWILMSEDDTYLPADFAVTLLAVARARDAQIVGAPWLPIRNPGEMEAAIERGRREAELWIGLSAHPSVFPTGDLETPFLNGVFLARRQVFDAVRYDASFSGNAWREETSMFLTATECGFRCVLTPRTASFQLGQWAGGQRSGRLAYEAWAIRNNWRFLREHRRELTRMGEIRAPVTAQARFVAERISGFARGYARARRRALLTRRVSGESRL
jgi:glycosyltransferase involved in cell wall biosynthesis